MVVASGVTQCGCSAWVAVKCPLSRCAEARDVDYVERRGATSNFLGYHGFPAVICTSPNNMIVHGIPGGYVLKEGDILSIDCGAIIEGYHGDAAFTMAVGEVSPLAVKLLETTERSLWAGIEQMTRGNSLNEIGRAVQNVAEVEGGGAGGDLDADRGGPA